MQRYGNLDIKSVFELKTAGGLGRAQHPPPHLQTQ